jgi:hypothetical protein
MHREQHSQYYHAKHGCYLCGGVNDVVDTGVFVEGEGVLAICAPCIKGDLLLALGIDLRSLERAVQQQEEAQEQIKRLRKQVRDLRARAKEPASV